MKGRYRAVEGWDVPKETPSHGPYACRGRSERVNFRNSLQRGPGLQFSHKLTRPFSLRRLFAGYLFSHAMPSPSPSPLLPGTSGTLLTPVEQSAPLLGVGAAGAGRALGVRTLGVGSGAETGSGGGCGGGGALGGGVAFGGMNHRNPNLCGSTLVHLRPFRDASSCTLGVGLLRLPVPYRSEALWRGSWRAIT